MGTAQYVCEVERRRQEVLAHAELNGIDFVEVIDRDYLDQFGAGASESAYRQRTLLLHLLKDLSPAVFAQLTAEHFEIEGGVRITPVRVEWAAVAGDDATLDQLVAGGELASAAEKDLLRTLAGDEPGRVVILRTDRAGDYSLYRLGLVALSGASDPFADMDGPLSGVAFSFKIECPSAFDCKTSPACPPEETDEPVIDYLSKDYASFRRLMFDRLSVIMPDWTERNPADLGVTLVELLAYAADRLSYFQDAAATEAYLGTARRRISIRRHARLLDYSMHDGCNARAWVQFRTQTDGVVLHGPDADSGSSGALLLTTIPGRSTVLDESDLSTLLSGGDVEVFELIHGVTAYVAHNEMRLYEWSDERCCLPEGATRATLYDGTFEGDAWNHDDDHRLRLRVGDVVIFEERSYSDDTGSVAADPAQRHAVRLTRVSPEAAANAEGLRTPGTAVVDRLTGVPVVEIEWAAEDALPLPLCLGKTGEDGLYRSTIVSGNIALADHGRTISDEALGEPPPAYSLRRYRPALAETGVTMRTPGDDAHAQAGPASWAHAQDPAEAMPAVLLADGTHEWTPRRDLLDSERFDRHFVVETEEDGRGWVRFGRGDDDQGLAPGAGEAFVATYRVGNGTAGNVGAEAIGHLVVAHTPSFEGIESVRNPLPARGGVDPEAMKRVVLDAPQAFRIQERAVTEADYAEVCQRHAEVQRAIATRRWTGSWHTMFITVDRVGGRAVDGAFEREMRAHIERYRLAGHDVEFEPPAFVPLDIVMTVCVEAGYMTSDVRAMLLDVFSDEVRADGSLGFFHPDNFSFGQPVYLSRIVAAAMAVGGVRWVDLTDRNDSSRRFRRWGEEAHGESDAGFIPIGRLQIARLDNDPSFPEYGRIDFLMEGGS